MPDVTHHVVYSPARMHCVHCMHLTRPGLCISEMRNLCLYWVTGQRYSEPLFRNLFHELHTCSSQSLDRDTGCWGFSTYKILKVLFLVASWLACYSYLLINKEKPYQICINARHLAPPNVCFCVQEPQRSVNYCTFLIHVLLNCDLVWNGFRLRHPINNCLQSVALIIKYSQSVAL